MIIFFCLGIEFRVSISNRHFSFVFTPFLTYGFRLVNHQFHNVILLDFMSIVILTWLSRMLLKRFCNNLGTIAVHLVLFCSLLRNDNVGT